MDCTFSTLANAIAQTVQQYSKNTQLCGTISFSFACEDDLIHLRVSRKKRKSLQDLGPGSILRLDTKIKIK